MKTTIILFLLACFAGRQEPDLGYQVPPAAATVAQEPDLGYQVPPAPRLYKVGNGVSAPALLYKVEPEYTKQARKRKIQGAVVLYTEIDPEGRAVNTRVMRSLGYGLDEKAIACLKRWKFRPSYKDGKPVTVAATIEMNFVLLDARGRPLR